MTTWNNAVWLDPLVVAGLVVTVGTTFARFASRRWQAWQQFKQMLTDWHGTPERPGVPRRPGVLERLENGDRAFGDIRAELSVNGGDRTLKEVVLAVRKDVSELKRRQDGGTG